MPNELSTLLSDPNIMDSTAAYDKAIAEQLETQEYNAHAERWGGTPSLLSHIVDLVSRGEYASANIADYLTTRPGWSEVFSPEGASHIASLAGQGITGEKKNTYPDLVDRVFPHWSKTKRFVVGLTASIALDPSTYIPAKWLALPVKALSETKPIKAVAKSVEESRLGELFIPHAGTPPAFKEFMQETRAAKQAASTELIEDIKQLNKGLTKEDREMFSFYRQHPDQIDKMPPHLQTRLDEIGSRFDDMIEQAYARGSISEESYKTWKIREGTYLPGVYAGQHRLSGVLPPVHPTEKPSFLKRKKFETLEDAKALSDDFASLSKAKSLDEMSLMAEARGIDFASAFKAAEGQDLPLEAYQAMAQKYAERYRPEEDILKLYGVRALEDIAWRTRDTYIDDVITQFGSPVPWDTKVLPPGKSLYFPKGKLRFYMREALSPKAADILDDAISKFKDIASKEGGEVSSKVTKTVTKTPISEAAGEGAKSTKVWEQRVRESMQNRGFSEGEANIAIEKIRESGGSTTSDKIIETIVETREETFKQSANLDSLDDLIPASTLSSLMERIPSITRKVPAYMIDTSVAREVNRATRALTGDRTTNWFLRLADNANNAWKTMATSLRLPFHLRNFYSNIFLAHQAGIDNPARFLEALDIQQAIFRKSDRVFKFGNYSYTPEQMRRALNFLGIRGTGWLGGDIEQRALSEIEWVLQGKSKYLKRPDKTIAKLGRSVGTAIEDNARIAVFIDQLKKGATPKQAGAHVRKHLFDYTELTPFERDIAKRFIPFYTWTRKNLPLQIEQLLTNPKVHNRYGKVLRAYDEPETAQEMTEKPRYFDKLMYRKTSMQTSQGKPVYAALDVPPNILNTIADSNNFLSSLGPYRVIGELITNKKFFPVLSDIEKEPGALVRAPIWVQALPDPIFQYAEKKGWIAPMTDIQSPEGLTLGIRGKWLHAIHTAVPILSEIGRTNATPITLTDERPEMWKRSYLTGITQKALDLEQQETQTMFDRGKVEERLQFYVKQRQKLPTKAEIPALFPEDELRNIVEREFIDFFTTGEEAGIAP